MENCKPVSTPMMVHEKLSRDSERALSDEDSFQYHSIIDGLQYLTLTRPNIAFVVNKVCQFLSAPTEVHQEAVNCMLQFVKGRISTGLCIRKSNSTLHNVFTDVDWAGCTDDYRSGGFAVFFGSNIISWSTRKLPTISRSSTEAEYKALSNGTAASVAETTNLALLGPCLVALTWKGCRRGGLMNGQATRTHAFAMAIVLQRVSNNELVERL
ncbi:uncharacterized mitochondrial protein AtMg00810-like [Phragmites australis]|uniref:uncharacterized mitochondrial protein AtMg00810-like n=1 Tax=Phragmites australis TaxID=29695 RepID=UPI002D7A3D0D|nr:uncharacterized mitochondrial protein AtMg00810-like [Phragmites australis]